MNWLLHFLHIFLFIFFYNSLSSQSGIIFGVILDNESGEPIIGGSVFLEDNQSIGSITDIDGYFEIRNLESGTYNVIVSYLSYETIIVTNVVVRESERTELNIVLSPSSLTLSEAVVVDYRRTNTDAAILLEIKKANQIVSGISSQQIGRTLDRDAGQVVRRIPGVLLSGNFINIRGLNERYNTVMLHEGFAPSMEADVKSFSFDIIPSSQIDRILVYKSPSADQPGEFAGGLVKLYTRNFPDTTFNSASVSFGYRENTTFHQFRHQDNGSLHFTSFSYPHHRLPDDFPSDIRRVTDGREIERIGKSLPNNWEAQSSTALPDLSLSFARGSKWDIGNWQLGNITALNYSNSKHYVYLERQDFDSYDFNNEQSRPIFLFEDDQYNQSVRIGILHNWALRKPGTTIEFNNLFNHNASTQYVNRLGNHFDFSFLPDNHSFDHIYRGIYNGQLSGKHQINGNSSEAKWMIGYSNTFRNQPDYKRYRSDRDDQEEDKRTLYVPFGQAQAFFLGRFFSQMEENNFNASASYTLRLPGILGGNEIVSLSAGSFFEYKKRNFQARNIGYVRGNTTTFPMENLDLTISELFEKIDNVTGIRIDEQSNPNDSYEADNTLIAIFGKAEIPFAQRFRVIAGLRMEHNTQTMVSQEQNGSPVNEKHITPSFLPSINLSYNLSNTALIRAAWGMTLNRPEFRELAPFSFYDFNFNFTYKGNPNLETPIIQNADLRLEVYPNPGEVISLAAFYKHFKDPIEVVFVPGAGSGGAKNFTFQNAESAFSAGFELELRKNLSNIFDSKLLERMGIMLNAALIFSEVNLSENVVAQSQNRPLIGQSPYIVNAGLFYNNLQKGFQVNIMYHVVGERIMLAGFDDYPDIYEMPRNQIDISLSYRLSRSVDFNIGISDLLNEDKIWMQDANLDGKFDTASDQIIQTYNPGRLITTGFAFRF